MDYKAKYPEVHKMLKQYKNAPYWIEAKKKRIKEKESARREFSELRATCMSGMPGNGGTSDPTAGYTEQVDFLTTTINELTAQIQELEQFIDYVENLILQCFNGEDSNEAKILFLKFRDGKDDDKYIYCELKIHRNTLNNLWPVIYSKIDSWINFNMQNCAGLCKHV